MRGWGELGLTISSTIQTLTKVKAVNNATVHVTARNVIPKLNLRVRNWS